MTTTTRAAVMWQPGQWWDIVELELDDPKAHEVLVRFEASGLCHSDDHVRTGDVPVRYPMVGGHEGAGVVEKVGPHGRTGQGRRPDRLLLHPGLRHLPALLDGCTEPVRERAERRHRCPARRLLPLPQGRAGPGRDVRPRLLLRARGRQRVGLREAARRHPLRARRPRRLRRPHRLGHRGERGGRARRPDRGGVRRRRRRHQRRQGAAYAGARTLVVVDPVEFKREKALEFGATHAFATAAEALEFVTADTWGRLADHALVTVGVLSSETVNHAVNVVGKNGTVTIAAVGNAEESRSRCTPGCSSATRNGSRARSSAAATRLVEIPRMFELYRAGHLKLDELITTRYKLDQVSQGYQDMLDGKNLRGMIIHEHL